MAVRGGYMLGNHAATCKRGGDVVSCQSPERSGAGILPRCSPGGEGGDRQWSHT